MTTQAQLRFEDVLEPVASARRELRERLRELVLAQGSRKAAWRLLRSAGITSCSLGTYYHQIRSIGLEATLDAMFETSTVEQIRTLIENPPAVPRRVAVSTLASQYYCEMQVHLSTTHDVRVVTPELAAGAAGHASFEAEAEPLDETEIARKIQAGETFGLVELPLTADFGGVKVMGRADRVQLEGRKAQLVLEFKFSGRREMYAPHVVQVQGYGLLLSAHEFDTTNLVHAVAVVPRGSPRIEGLADLMAARAIDLAQSPWPATNHHQREAHVPDPMEGTRARRLDTTAFTLWVFPHDPTLAQRNVEWALGYWKGSREPVPTPSPGKCRACPYNAANLCNVPRAAPDGRYSVRTIRESDELVHLLVKRPK